MSNGSLSSRNTGLNRSRKSRTIRTADFPGGTQQKAQHVSFGRVKGGGKRRERGWVGSDLAGRPPKDPQGRGWATREPPRLLPLQRGRPAALPSPPTRGSLVRRSAWKSPGKGRRRPPPPPPSPPSRPATSNRPLLAWQAGHVFLPETGFAARGKATPSAAGGSAGLHLRGGGWTPRVPVGPPSGSERRPTPLRLVFAIRGGRGFRHPLPGDEDDQWGSHCWSKITSPLAIPTP